MQRFLADQIATPFSNAPALLCVHAGPDQIVNSFDPDKALATSMDIQSRPAIDRIYTPETVRLCLSAGWGPINYRLHTPETIDYWHWNPKGQWTDEANQRGYFVGSADLGEPIRDSFGFSLPHRGCTYMGWKARLDADRIREIIAKNFHTGRTGISGNDDSGAMSS
jgi:hypothetical protein